MRLQTLTLVIAGLAAPLGAFAQAAPAAAPATSAPSAQSEAGEPRAMTSEPTPAPAPAAAPAQAPTPRPASGRPAAAGRLGFARAGGDRPGRQGHHGRPAWNWALRP